MRLGLRVRDVAYVISAVLIICNRIGLCRKLAVEDGIRRNRVVKIERRTVLFVVLHFGVPCAKIVALALGVYTGSARGAAPCNRLREALAGQRNDERHAAVRNLALHDLDFLRAGHVGDGICAIARLLHAVDIHAYLIAVIRRKREGVAAAMLDDRCRAVVRLRAVSHICNPRRKVTDRHHDGIGQLAGRRYRDHRIRVCREDITINLSRHALRRQDIFVCLNNQRCGVISLLQRQAETHAVALVDLFVISAGAISHTGVSRDGAERDIDLIHVPFCKEVQICIKRTSERIPRAALFVCAPAAKLIAVALRANLGLGKDLAALEGLRGGHVVYARAIFMVRDGVGFFRLGGVYLPLCGQRDI